MNNSNTEKNWTRLTVFVSIIACVLLVFSFVAPIIFTSFSSKWDFTETGQIGDTLGGIMNPFIAIVGVMMTFLAFYMQVKANKIQRDQFLTSLEKNKIEEKIDCYYKLQLINTDISTIVKDINQRMENIQVFVNHQKENPFKFSKVNRATLKHYDRVASLDRLSLYKGFKIFLSSNNDWIKQFNNLYSIIDHIPESFKEAYSIIDYHNKDISEDKMNIRNQLIKLEGYCVKMFNSNVKHKINHELNIILKKFIDEYRNEIDKSTKNKTESDFPDLGKLLDSFVQNIKKYFDKVYYDEDVNEVVEYASSILININYVIQKSNQLFPEFEDFEKRMNKGEDSMIQRLSDISKMLDDALRQTSVEQIRKEYNVLPN